MFARGVTSIAGALALASATASAQAAMQPAASPAAPAATQSPVLKHLPKSAAVVIELAESVSSDDRSPGAVFSLRLAEPVVVDGVVVLPAGLTGEGEVIDARQGGLGGKAGTLVLAARYLTYDGRQIPLRAMKLSGSGQGHAGAALAAEMLGGHNAAAGMLIRGDEMVMPSGTRADAEIGEDVDLSALGPAPTPTPSSADAASVPTGSAVAPPARSADVASTTRLSPPPPGKGQVVFYRQSSIFGAAFSYSIHEGDAKLGHLGMGHYRVVVAEPGRHTYNLHSLNGETITLEVEPGETYYVKQGIAAGYGFSNPFLEPSDQAAFDQIAAKLKPEH